VSATEPELRQLRNCGLTPLEEAILACHSVITTGEFPWSNWADLAGGKVETFYEPGSLSDIVPVVQEAQAANKRIRGGGGVGVRGYRVLTASNGEPRSAECVAKRIEAPRLEEGKQ
jgi:hypothetical protein